MKHKENETYQLVPGGDGDQHWLVRFLEGPFAETIIQYGSISINEEDEGIMTFNFFVEQSPDSELTSENTDLQLWAGDVLQEIIRDAVVNETAILREK
tara:strand:- start:3364 stop:3657 length:294 start_codon:yes stop_codon:yes gene_type:complete